MILLITGGTGSFGKKFIEKYNKDFKKIIVYSRDEFKQDEMKKQFKDFQNIRYFIGDVRDEARLKRAMHDVDIVVHAAALKQVPSCEYNPIEAVKTNIHGAENVINAALDSQVKKVIALSTDKAVNPINLYGATKLVSDKLFINANAYSGKYETSFSVVRYGNVAGSRGSVIPLFKQQETLTVTSEEMTRFNMTLDQACELVKHAIDHAKGGEIFVAKLKAYMVSQLINEFKKPYKIIGPREGEKMHEIMITTHDNCYEYKNHFIIYPDHDWFNFKTHFTPGGKKCKINYSSDIAERMTESEVADAIRFN